MASSRHQRKIRYAVIGLGHIAQTAVLPAFGHAKSNSELAALVSGNRKKLKKLGQQYKVDLLFDYDHLEQCLDVGNIDAIYIATPNSMHKEHALRAISKGVHVLCEKPLSVTVRDCQEMLKAAERGAVLLMTAYRLHFEEANLEVLNTVKRGRLGELKYFNSIFSMDVKEGNIRLDKALGGGALFDIGIYCINAARMLFQSEPIEVVAWASRPPEDPRFDEVAETVSASMRFKDAALAQFTISFGAAHVSEYRIVGTQGDLRLEPAYQYNQTLVRTLTIGEKRQVRRFRKRDQFAPEIIYFSNCILHNKQPEPSAEEGLLDVRVIEAMQESIRSRRPIELSPYERVQRPQPHQEKTIEPIRSKPKTIHVSSPH